MKKRKLYIYNPETDNFERFYPSFKDRFKSFVIYVITSVLIGLGIFFFIYYVVVGEPTEENLKAKNASLQQHYNKLDKRVSEVMKTMEALKKRGDVAYRIVMQLDSGNTSPLEKSSQYLPAIDNYDDSKLMLSISEKLDVIENHMVEQSMAYDEIKETASKFKDRISHIPAVLPIHKIVYTISSGYGKRIDPVTETPKFHAGIDFAADYGTAVYATADGKINFTGNKGGYGNCIEIDHGNNYMTRYGHLSAIDVKRGQEVKRGQLIGKVGSSGKSTGPHLHYEVRINNAPQNPVNYYYLDLTPEEYDEMIKYAEAAGHIMD